MAFCILNNEQAHKEILKKSKDSLHYFAKIITPSTFYYESAPFHYELCNIIENRDNIQVCLEAPRGFGKSTYLTYLALHHLLFDKGPKNIIIQSKTRDNSIDRLTKIKNILEYNPNFRALYGYWGEQSAKIWREDRIVLKDGSVIQAKGTGQMLRGANVDDTRITLLIVDDPEDEANTKTSKAMDDNFRKLLTGISGLDPRNGRVVVIGTPLHQNCIVERLIRMKGWITKKYQSYNEKTEEVLWEQLWPLDKILAKKEELASAHRLSIFYSEYQCEITGDDDQKFKEEHLRHWDGFLEINEHDEQFLHITHRDKKRLLEEEIRPVNIYLGIDPASSESERSDYSTTVPVAYDDEKNVYVLDYYEKQVLPTDHASQIIRKIKELKPKRAHVESTAYQEKLRLDVKAQLEDEGIYQLGLEKKWLPRRGKDDRLEDLLRFTVYRKLYLKESMDSIINELLLFPRGNKNLMDGLWYATRIMRTPSHVLKDRFVSNEEDKEKEELSYMAA